jgi:prepilin-type N-terminal cleavage/methylation domain-containing protein
MKRSIQNNFRNSSKRGFTLVEMLVSVALVLLMMTMFTSIFQMATNSVSKQRIIAETDQRARSLTTILRADFAKRSMRTSFPFLPFEDTARTAVPFGNRQGYVYISCNDPASGQDDLIQITVDARQIQTNPDQSLYYGAGQVFWDKIAENNGATMNTTLQFNPNQPEADEGDMSPNGASGSNGAEISVFLRGGNLIRRVMLLRDPLPVAGQDLEIQPTSGFQNPFILDTTRSQSGSGLPEFYLAGATTVPQSDFWRYFDFSAVPEFTGAVHSGMSLIGLNELANDGGAVPALGRPHFRFGFNNVTGLSREHESASGTAQFMGRYLQAETSANFTGEDFNWPLQSSSVGNPMDITNVVTLNANTGLVNEFDGPFGRGGVRRVEDVLMSNVREFRVELWDTRLERWVVPGHQIVKNAGTPQAIAGDYHVLRNAQRDISSGNIAYGPLQVPGVYTGTPHVFDTWHPSASINFDGDAVSDIFEHHAPYYPMKYYPPVQGVAPPGPTVPFPLTNPATEFDPVSGRTDANKGYWTNNQAYSVGDVVFARTKLTVPGWNDNFPNTEFEWALDAGAIPNQSVHIAYRCVGVMDNSLPLVSGATAPGWQSPGLRFVDGNLIWEGFSNISPLKSVRLTVRFTEPTSETPKQLTLIMPLTDEER